MTSSEETIKKLNPKNYPKTRIQGEHLNEPSNFEKKLQVPLNRKNKFLEKLAIKAVNRQNNQII